MMVPSDIRGQLKKDFQFIHSGITEIRDDKMPRRPISLRITWKSCSARASRISTICQREISRAYGVLNEERFYSNRAYFLIDKVGRVRWSHVEGNNSQRRENSEILAAIKLLS